MKSGLIDKFLEAYIECALWASTDEDGEPLDGLYSADDLAPECLEQMREDCTDFFQANIADLVQHGSAEQCGHDFWLTRNGHGAGFWDRGTGDVGRRLTDAAHVYGSCDLYIGDNGFIYCT